MRLSLATERAWTSLGAVLAALCACGGTRFGWKTSEPAWDASEAHALAGARVAEDAGRSGDAWAIVAPLTLSHPSDLDLATWLQDLRLELLARGLPLDPALDPWRGEAKPEEALRKLYADQAREHEAPAALVLAARMESDAIAAITLLDRALELSPDLAWAHYGRAHALLRHKSLIKRWELAREALQRALALDPGLIGARRLEAWMLAQEGLIPSARRALDAWLASTRADLRVSRAERAEAEVDLALLRVLDGDPEGAQELCQALEGEPMARSRRLAVLAVAAAEMGALEEALESARRAHDSATSDVLPLVQQALLQQYWLRDEEAARGLWHEILSRAAGRPDLSTLLQGMRAQLQLEREAGAVEPAQEPEED